ncbi:MAG: hypothetical protein RJB66_2718 [Pseudomonadota bacterium]|jgi:hypothetical protein
MSSSNSSNNEDLVLQCRRVESGNDESQNLTVGDLFKVECPTQSFFLNPSKLKFITKRPYDLQVLSADLQPDGRLQLMVTSYQVGDFKSEKLKLSDGLAEVPVSGITFKVESVIDKKNPPQGPFGPFGGHSLNLPPLYFWSFLALALVLLVAVGLKSWRKLQRKRLIEGLKKHDSRLGPQSQLHVRFRQLERQRLLDGGELQNYTKEIEDILRLFVVRQFRIPAYDWSDRLILADFQKRYAFLGVDVAKDLMVLLRETRKASALASPQAKDIEQLVRKIKKWADQVDRSTGAQGRARGASL